MICTEDLLKMSKFDNLYNSIVSEAPLKDYISAAKRKIGADKPGFLDRVASKAVTGATGLASKAVSGLGNVAGKAIGVAGQALGTGGKALPGAGALQTGVQRAAGLAGKAIAGTGSTVGRVFDASADIVDDAVTGYKGAPGYVTVKSDAVPRKMYQTNDKISLKDKSGKTLTGLYAGTFKGKDGQMYVNLLDPTYN